ncbi:YfhO family protein [Vaginisenegalia massiliensis]|uniref:YfhO family protein n=1 Tax=Vaginisenegalia massiliensis TaxID=2058294 RepID=UPI000F53E792|nr:YfhO family protein [Vaginisenegalia massiliensis]
MKQTLKVYGLSWLLLSGILIVLACLFEFAPFGNETLLTVDLGQQYIDFFAYFKHTLLTQHDQFLYSFSKGIGGEMIGLCAYYLMSPFNLIFLFLKENHFAMGVQLVLYGKLLASCWSFQYFTRQKYSLTNIMSACFSLCYCLMSYIVAFNFNIMWLDAIIYLPLIALGLDHLIKGQSIRLYVLSLSLCLISSYYMGYMICLFLTLYSVYVMIENQIQFSRKTLLGKYGRFVGSSGLAVGLSAFILIPNILSLQHSKASHTRMIFNWQADYDLKSIAGKLFLGAFDFDQLAKGAPLIYVGLLCLVLALFYFTNKAFPLIEKLWAVCLVLIFYLAFHFNSFNRIWHGGQAPIWYEHRFSFLLCFFILILAIKSYSHWSEQSHLTFKLGLSMLAFTGFSAYYYFQLDKTNNFSYLNPTKIGLSLVFMVILLFALNFPQNKFPLQECLLLGLVTCELMTNAGLILAEMSYVDESKFYDYTQQLRSATDPYKQGPNEFYRIHKTFQRTKNEAFYGNYYGLDHFASTIEAPTTDLFAKLGLPASKGFANYSNGTLFTDDLFSVRYLLEPSPQSGHYTRSNQYQLSPSALDIDNEAYPIIAKQQRYQIRENTDRFGLGFEVSARLTDPQTRLSSNQPIENQELLLSLINFDGSTSPFYIPRNFSKTQLNQVKITDKGDGDFYTYQKTKPNLKQIINQVQDSTHPSSSSKHHPSVSLFFDTQSQNPYYFTLPSQFSQDNVRLKLNNQPYAFYSPIRSRQITNASYKSIRNNQVLSFELKEDKLKANLIKLYEFDLPRYQQLVKKHQANQFKVTEFHHHWIKGEIKAQQSKGYVLFTIPFDSSWQVKVDGKRVKTVAALNQTLLAIPITAGHHQIELTYLPISLFYGWGISLLCLAISWWIWRRQKASPQTVDA